MCSHKHSKTAKHKLQSNTAVCVHIRVCVCKACMCATGVCIWDFYSFQLNSSPPTVSYQTRIEILCVASLSVYVSVCVSFVSGKVQAEQHPWRLSSSRDC